MNIAQLNYSLQSGGLEIFVSGCNATAGCSTTCHTKHLWDFSAGDSWENWKDRLIEETNYAIVKEIYILGGEPLDCNLTELKEFLQWLKQITEKKITLFTHYGLNFVLEKNLKGFVDSVKIGEFDINKAINSELFELQSTNQKFVDLNNESL